MKRIFVLEQATLARPVKVASSSSGNVLSANITLLVAASGTCHGVAASVFDERLPTSVAAADQCFRHVFLHSMPDILSSMGNFSLLLTATIRVRLLSASSTALLAAFLVVAVEYWHDIDGPGFLQGVMAKAASGHFIPDGMDHGYLLHFVETLNIYCVQYSFELSVCRDTGAVAISETRYLRTAKLEHSFRTQLWHTRCVRSLLQHVAMSSDKVS